MKDYYKVLGVPHNATPDAIKTKYRALMKEFHPDLHQDPIKKKECEQKSQEINEAYSALTDGNNHHGSNPGMDDFLKNLFNNINAMHSMRIIETAIEVSFHDLLVGSEVKIKLPNNQEIPFKLNPKTSPGSVYNIQLNNQLMVRVVIVLQMPDLSTAKLAKLKKLLIK